MKNGTGRMLQSANFDIAGKTGTAKIVNSNKGYGDDYQASFVGYFPADQPKYSCIVTIAGPTKQIYGAQVSGTVFTAIADKVYATNMQYHEAYQNNHDRVSTVPSVKYGLTQDTRLALKETGVSYADNSQGTQWSVALPAQDKVKIQKRTIGQGVVPNVVGMPLNDAVYLCENSGLRVSKEGHGKVVKQEPSAGQVLQRGTQIKLVLR